MNHKDIEPVTPGFMDKPPCYDIQLKRMEERNAAREKASLSAQPSPGASPTEDGLIEKALRVMGADITNDRFAWLLNRLNRRVSQYLLAPVHQALFIHECRLYLREKGFNEFRIRHYPSGFVLFDAVSHFDWCWSVHRESISSPALQTEHEAYAQAVLAASGQEIGQAETQAPSTTSHQTETQPWRLGDYE